jgi:hypothetical protein
MVTIMVKSEEKNLNEITFGRGNLYQYKILYFILILIFIYVVVEESPPGNDIFDYLSMVGIIMVVMYMVGFIVLARHVTVDSSYIHVVGIFSQYKINRNDVIKLKNPFFNFIKQTPEIRITFRSVDGKKKTVWFVPKRKISKSKDVLGEVYRLIGPLQI